MQRRILALATGLMVAGALAPSANAAVKTVKQSPTTCNTTIANVVGGDPICETSELRQPE
jgi:hypothetical protein